MILTRMNPNISSTVLESSFRTHHCKSLMSAPVAHRVLTVVRELIEADTVFFRIAVALPEPTRGRALGNRARMTHDVLALMRIILEASGREAARFVLRIPFDGPQPEQAWEDVRVTPTTAQLEVGIEHNVADLAHDSNCAVCQEVVLEGSRLRNCRHLFHRDCIMNWFEMSSRCPVCRDDIRVPRADNPAAPAPSAGGSHSTRG